MENICSAAPNSPLCGKWELYERLQDITYSRYDKDSRIWEIMLGIAYAESHIGQSYTKDNVGGTCYWRNNWGWVKAKVLDSGKVIADQKLPDQYNCWLYKFDTIENYWTSKVNIITQNYRSCLSRDKPIECIAYNYVGNPKVAEPNWIKNVASFLITDEMMNVGHP
jgi:hypothetical protein